MSRSALPAPTGKTMPPVGPLLARSHDRCMALCDQVLGPVMDPDATFVQRWGALRFVSERLQERCSLERKLLDEVQSLLPREVRDRLRSQAAEVLRLRQDVERLARGRCTARDLAHSAQDLVQALRLWYAEIEFALGDIQQRDISRRAAEILTQLNYRPVWNGRP